MSKNARPDVSREDPSFDGIYFLLAETFMLCRSAFALRATAGHFFRFAKKVVELIGIEPMTSSLQS